MKRLISSLVSLVFFLSGCAGEVDEKPQLPTAPTETEEDFMAAEIDRIADGMTLDEKIYQMIFATPEAVTGVSRATKAGEATKEALSEHPVGGIVYFAANLRDEEQIKEMLGNTTSYSKIPLFIGVDEEGGRVARLGNNPNIDFAKHPAMKNVKTIQEAYSIGNTLGRELKELLFNVDFAPVADVIIYEKNSEIGDRSFGSDPVRVADMVGEMVKGLEDGGVLSVLKHFPGHGSTRVNSHTGYSESTREAAELRNCEFLPFKKGIEAGCNFVMVSHMTLVNAVKEKLPSSLSSEVIEGFLKGELNFDGIVITDSLSMGAITEEYDEEAAAVMAVKAGCDMLLMPPDVQKAKDAVKNAVENGEIDEERIDLSVKKILKVKLEKGIID